MKNFLIALEFFGIIINGYSLDYHLEAHKTTCGGVVENRFHWVGCEYGTYRQLVSP